MTENNPFGKHAKVTIIVLIVFGFLFTDLLFANIYKILYGDSYYNKIMNPNNIVEKQYRVFSKFYHHGLEKNIVTTARSGPIQYPMTTNSMGFRDQTNRLIPKKSDKYRIIFMGDSFVEGTGVAYTDSLVGILAQKYANKYDILNAGVISYAPTVYYRKSRYLIENYGLRFDEMIVFIDISDISDEVDWYASYDETISLDSPLPTIIPETPTTRTVKQFFRDNSILYAIPRFIKNRKLISGKASSGPENNPTIQHRRALWTVDKAHYYKYAVAGLKKAKANILNLKTLLDKYKIQLSLVVYPWPTQVFYSDLNSIQVTEWKTFCQRNNINFINLFPDFISKKNKNNKKAILEYYIKNDMHWNEKGNRKAADGLVRKLAIFR